MKCDIRKFFDNIDHLIHQDKEYLRKCLIMMREYAKQELELDFNEKTEIFPIKNGVDYLGWHIYLTDSGKVVRKVKQQTKYKYKRKLRYFEKAYAEGKVSMEEIKQVLSSYNAHLSHGHTFKLRKKVLDNVTFQRESCGKK